jgi:hypothetical protein
MPTKLNAQSITLGGPAAVASAQDFATLSFQDPWDMNERTDFGWFLHGADLPSPQLTNISFSGGIFSATTGNGPNLFLLETGNPYAARLGKTGYNHPIDANFYKLIAIRMSIDGTTQAAFDWNRNDLWDGTHTRSSIITATPGWRTYFVDLTAPISGGPVPWAGLIRSLQFAPSYLNPYSLAIDWIRLVNIDPSLCRTVAVSGLTLGQFDLYLSDTSGGTAPVTVLARATDIQSKRASAGCAAGATNTYTFYAGGLAPGTYRVIASPSGGVTPIAVSSTAYVVNAAPTLTVTSPSEEGSTDDFAATQLGNPWDMDATTDVAVYFQIPSRTITNIATETPGGTPLGSTRVLYGTSQQASPNVGDPIMQMVWPPGMLIDPQRYRILTVEFGLPNAARSINTGSVARVAWRVAGGADSVSDDIIFQSRVGTNVLDKIIVDMADRATLPIEQGSQLGWVPGSSGTPGIDRFRFDVHEFRNPVPFYVKRIKLAAFERAMTGTNYTIRWNATKAGTVNVYRDTDRDPNNGGLTHLGSVSASAGAAQFVWNANVPGRHYIYVRIDDGQNFNIAYSRWPIVVGSSAGPPTKPSGFQIAH